MKKRLSCLALALVIALALSASAFAASPNFIIDPEGRVGETDTLNQEAVELYESYGYAPGYAVVDSCGDMQPAELAQKLYEENIGLDNGLLLLDCLDESKLYGYYFGEAQVLSGSFEEFAQAYDRAQTFRSGVSAYLKALAAILSEGSVPTRELVLLPDEPAEEAQEDDGLLQILPEESGADAVQQESTAFVPRPRQYELVLDQAGVLDTSELQRLIAMADNVSEQNKCDVAVAIVDDMDGRDAQAYADDLFDYSGYGYGDEDSGIILAVDVEDRKFAMSTHQLGAWAFTDYGLEWLEGRFIGYLGNSDWVGTAESFIEGCEELLSTAYSDKPYDVPQYGYYEEPSGIDTGVILIALAVGFGFGFLKVGSMKRKMQPVELKTGAADYFRRDSFVLDYNKDRYIRSTLTKVPRPKETTRSGGGGGGGSSMHISSSGRSHGGRSGSF